MENLLVIEIDSSFRISLGLYLILLLQKKFHSKSKRVF